MQASQIPSKVPLPFANSGTKNTIPTASQIGITPGAASLTDGFPPLTFTPLASGGVPPAGADFNGILNLITAVQQWQCAGGIFKYDSAFSTAIGGYPKGAVLISSSNDTSWLNLADNNATNPDATDGTAANWAPLSAYGITAVTGLTNANVTLTPAQYGKRIITLAGTLTGNVQIIFPTTSQQWLVINNTTGAFTVTCKTASGTGSTVAQGGQQSFYGDGTNLVTVVGNSATETLQGTAKVATQTLTDAGADDTTMVTPKKMRWGVSWSFTSNGYLALPSWLGGFIIQWGLIQTGAGGSVVVTLPIAYPNGQLRNWVSLLATLVSSAYIVGSDDGSNTQLTVFACQSNGTAAQVFVKWLSVGR